MNLSQLGVESLFGSDSHTDVFTLNISIKKAFKKCLGCIIFYRKQQRKILIELRSTKEGWGILPQKKTKQQEYKNKKLKGNNNKQTLLARLTKSINGFTDFKNLSNT